MSAKPSPPRLRIVGLGSELPKKILTNRDLERMVQTSDAWIAERTGVRERRIAQEHETASYLATAASKRALSNAGISPEEIDLIILATSTPDRLFPSTACLVQHRIGASRAVAFDLSAACSGFLFGLSVADAYFRAGVYRNALVIGSEVMSRITDWTDRTTCVLFGDGAGAAVVALSFDGRGILSSHLHSDGSLSDLIAVVPQDPPEAGGAPGRGTIRMKGSETFKVAVTRLAESAREALGQAGLSVDALDLVVPHQANIRILKAIAERLGLPMEKVFTNLDRYGNTSAASIPIALDEAAQAGRLRPGSLVLLLAFGGGLTWGSVLIRW